MSDDKKQEHLFPNIEENHRCQKHNNIFYSRYEYRSLIGPFTSAHITINLFLCFSVIALEAKKLRLFQHPIKILSISPLTSHCAPTTLINERNKCCDIVVLGVCKKSVFISVAKRLLRYLSPETIFPVIRPIRFVKVIDVTFFPQGLMNDDS